jgi:hypothetical protein
LGQHKRNGPREAAEQVRPEGGKHDGQSNGALCRYRLTRASEVSAFTTATNTSRSGVRRPGSIVTAWVRVWSTDVGARGVPSWKGSVLR